MSSTPAERLHARIEAEGPVPFAVFMEEALYGAGGYYDRPRPPIGAAGDYVTGSSLSPLFGRVTARLLGRLDDALGRPAELFEAGFGGGEHLRAVAEASPGRRLRAWDRVARPVPEGVERLDDLEAVGEGGIDGLVFSYELFDAQPVHRLVGREGGGPGELLVGRSEEGAFEWVAGELSDPALADLVGGVELGPGQVADLAPAWRPLYRRLAARLGRGLLVTCDYGFERRRLLDPRVRAAGTLACYRRQRVHRRALVAVGEQDLTAHVDFTALREEGERLGLETVALSRQARWLTACGLFDGLAQAKPEERREAMALLDGGGMGEEIRVLVQANGIEVSRLFDLEVLRSR